jgi:hypothetical protein
MAPGYSTLIALHQSCPSFASLWSITWLNDGSSLQHDSRCFIYSGKWIESVLNSRKQNALGKDTQSNKEEEEKEVHAARR